MADQPETVMVHTVHASRAHDEDRERATIERRLGIDVRVARTPPESRTLLADADIALCGGLPADLLDGADRLRWVQAFSSGVDGYPIDRLRDAGIVLTNVAGIHAEPIAEQALGYMLMFARRLHTGMHQQAQPRWERYEGDELADRTVAIIGVGAVGTRLATFAHTIGMRVLGIKRSPETAPDVVDEIYGPDGLFEVLPAADYVVIACPLTDETRGMIGGPEIDAMRNSAVLINIARGGIVDYDRLVVALQQHEIGGAALDVFPREPYDLDSPLWGLPNVIITPHMAGSSPRKPERIADVFERNYEAFVSGKPDEMPTRVV